MRIDIISSVPDLLASPLNESILKRAQEKGLVEIVVHNLHDYAHDRRKTTDDYPFGGEAGMVMKCEPVFELIEKLQGERTYDEIIYTSPDGVRYDQHEANRLSTLGNIVILCGHYKGIDHRIREHLITREISIGDYVLTGGELAACIIADSVVRLIPGAIGDEASALTDSFQEMEGSRRAAVGRLRPDRPLAGRTGVGAHRTAAARPAGRRKPERGPQNTGKMKYYLIAGEPSGDLHGANLIEGLKKADPAAEFRFWGGDRMAAAGGAENLRKHYRETSFFGIVQVLKNLRTIRRQMRECQEDVAAWRPDVLVAVDYPGFNMKMARWAKEHGIRVFYYIAPKVWAWREWRVKAIREYVDRLFVIFPFERDYFPRHGIRPVFEGNPLVDAIEARRPSLPSPAEFRRKHALDDRPIVALVAGSRRGEIRDNLPLMVRLAGRFPEYQFVVTGVPWLERALYDRYLAGSGIRCVCDQTYETIAAAEAAVVTSGTATLETALLGTPEVVVYRTLWFQVKLQPYVLKVPWVSLVNLNLGREAVAEIIQSDLSIERAERELRAILPGGSGRARMLADLAELRAVIGGPGASERFARRMVGELRDDTKQ